MYNVSFMYIICILLLRYWCFYGYMMYLFEDITTAITEIPTRGS